MNCLKKLFVMCVMVCLIRDSLTDGRNKTEEPSTTQQPTPETDTDIPLETGPPDSHEAMNSYNNNNHHQVHLQHNHQQEDKDFELQENQHIQESRLRQSQQIQEELYKELHEREPQQDFKELQQELTSQELSSRSQHQKEVVEEQPQEVLKKFKQELLFQTHDSKFQQEKEFKEDHLKEFQQEFNGEQQSSKIQQQKESQDRQPQQDLKGLQQELKAQQREKRSYEFLMGLINNNSRYELTRVDPSVAVTNEPEVTTGTGIKASELLLELMVRIAAHPDQWDNVHQLLHQLDDDLTASKNLVNKVKSESVHNKPSHVEDHRAKQKTIILPEKDDILTDQVNNHVEMMSKKYEPAYDGEKKWPFLNKIDNSVQFVNSNSMSSIEDKTAGKQTTQIHEEEKTTEPAVYHQKFAYHRVTGTPFNLNKDPKAYIAVSVIAPKPINSVSKDNDLTLENELHQLKPWTHSQNLKNMESIRSRWVIQTDDNVKTAL